MRKTLTAVSLSCIVWPSLAQAKPHSMIVCGTAPDPRDRIPACSVLIRLGQSTKAQLVAAYISRGNSYEAEGRHEQAIADETRAIVLDPEVAVAYGNRGVAFEHIGQLDQAISDETRAISLDRGNTQAYDPVAGVYSSASKRGYKDQYYSFRAIAYRQKGQFREAIADLTQSIAFAEGQWIAIGYANRGDTYEAAGLHEEAAADYERARAAGLAAPRPLKTSPQ